VFVPDVDTSPFVSTGSVAVGGACTEQVYVLVALVPGAVIVTPTILPKLAIDRKSVV
jgi:hypothetical protein